MEALLSVASTMIVLIFVLALAWISLLLLKRFKWRPGIDQDAGLQIIRAWPLGGRERLVVVHFGGQRLLLGITGQSINLIAQTSSPLSTDAAQDASPSAAPDIKPGTASGAEPTAPAESQHS